MVATMSIYEKITEIQNRLNVPKTKYNQFGDFYYRSLEDILEGIKPLLKEYKCLLTISDEIEESLGKIFIVSTVTILDIETGQGFSVKARAMMDESKSKMDKAQMTGSSSSYARKYALNGLFLIDDNKDSDSEEYQRMNQQPKQQSKQQPKQQSKTTSSKKPKTLGERLTDSRLMFEQIEIGLYEKLKDSYKKTHGIEEISPEEAVKLLDFLVKEYQRITTQKETN